MNETAIRAMVAEMRNAVANFKVGEMCVVPGMGAGMATTEEDLENMKVFVNRFIDRLESSIPEPTQAILEPEVQELPESETSEGGLEIFSDFEEE